MCEAERRLKQISHALDQMGGTWVIDLGKLKQLADAQCEHTKQGDEAA